MQISKELKEEIDECKGNNYMSDVGVLWCIIPTIDLEEFPLPP